MKTPFKGLPANDPLGPELERIARKYERDAFPCKDDEQDE